jgi:NADH pyrophosphatase NudC (nudix superfamily)
MTHEHEDAHAAGAHVHPDSINPALEGVRFCPRCGHTPRIDFPRSLQCDNCGYAAFYNPKPVAGAIPREPDGRIWLLRRGFDPGAGLWTFPGGFVDLGESVEHAARRGRSSTSTSSSPGSSGCTRARRTASCSSSTRRR